MTNKIRVGLFECQRSMFFCIEPLVGKDKQTDDDDNENNINADSETDDSDDGNAATVELRGSELNKRCEMLLDMLSENDFFSFF